MAVYKPLNWTSNDVVEYVRARLEIDARKRGLKPARVGSRRNKSRIVKVGHGGTLDPLATGVLVLGIGKGTKELRDFLTGPKSYRAAGKLGFETTTLDMEGEVVKKAPFDHVTEGGLQRILPELTGKIQQIPPIFSAIRKDGKRLYKEAREGKTAEDIQIDPREVEIVKLELLKTNIPDFEIDVQCGGGTYIRSLIRDMGYKVNSVATTTKLERTQQGQFKINDALPKEQWSADTIYAAVERFNAERESLLNES